MKQRDMERALGILCAVLCIVGLLTGCGRIQEEGPSDPAGPVEPAGPESPDRELPEPPADPQGPPAGQETLPQAPSGEAQVPALEGESPADVGWPDRKESAVTLRALVEKGGDIPGAGPGIFRLFQL